MPESNTPASDQPDADLQVEFNSIRPDAQWESRMARSVRQVLLDHDFHRGEISIAVVDDATIHQLNRRYLQHDYPTDVLAFNLETDARIGFLAGEIVISLDTAQARANEYGHPLADELLLYAVHAALHLVGYDDRSPSENRRMIALEQRYLELAGRGDIGRSAQPVAGHDAVAIASGSINSQKPSSDRPAPDPQNASGPRSGRLETPGGEPGGDTSGSRDGAAE